MNRSKVGLLSLVLVAGLAACDDATGPEDGLTQAEAAALAAVLMDQTLSAGDQGGAMAQQVNPLRAAAVVQFDSEVDITLPCALGGSVHANRVISGSMDDETGAGAFAFSLVQTHEACVVDPPDVNAEFTLNGAPDVTSVFQLSRDAQGAFEASGGIEGAIAWVSGDRSGTCEVSLQFSGNGDAQGSVSVSTSGNVCGASISENVSVTP